jgi:hypothetical protein
MQNKNLTIFEQEVIKKGDELLLIFGSIELSIQCSIQIHNSLPHDPKGIDSFKILRTFYLKVAYIQTKQKPLNIN